ncbi:MAG: hypothetical protein U5L01_13900 [Rheinheimera sp.]|nr:hypothetical protein [Rheinheimera sp.]
MAAISNFKRKRKWDILPEHGADINWNADGSMGIKLRLKVLIYHGHRLD